MPGYLGDWGLYPWFKEHGEDLIHSDDRSEFESLCPYGKLFLCESETEHFLTLRYGERSFRAAPVLFSPVAPPPFGFAERVRVMKAGVQCEGIIMGIEWHWKRAEPFFLLEVDGGRTSNRYWAADLSKG